MDFDELRRRAQAWRAADPDTATAEEVDRLLAEGNRGELEDRFAGALEFGTAGLRGLLGAGPNRMNRAVVRRTTAGLARYLKRMVPDVARRGVVVGRDGRRMSDEFAADTAAVLAAEGIPALFFAEPVPTPLTAFATLHLGAAAGVMVTASHNPPEYNGFKVYWGNGAQIIPPHDRGIATAIDEVEPANQVPLMPREQARASGLFRELSGDLGRAYLDAILRMPVHRGAAPAMSIVYTAMHGVGGRWMLEALAQAGFKDVHPVPEQHEPDGSFPTVRFPNPEEPGALDLALALAERVGADLLLANDPDADRLAVVARDASGMLRALNGNEVGVLLGHYLLTQAPRPARPLVVTTIVSSAQLGQIAADLGAGYDATLTGFKWIANRAMEREAHQGEAFVFGYEEALGYSVGTVVRDKDGISAGLVFADLAAWCRSRGTTVHGYLEEIQRRHGLFVSRQRSVTLPGAEGQAQIERIMERFRADPPSCIGALGVAAVNDYRTGERRAGGQVVRLTLPSSNVIAYELEGGSRVTLRPSGTEPKIKYYFELRENPRPDESIADARQRATEKLALVESAFLTLAEPRRA